MRIIGLDIGAKSCGVALSDALGITAQGKENIRFNDRDWTALLANLAPYFASNEIATIVIGYPTYPSGDKSATTLMIEEVAQLISHRFTRPVVFVAEDFTTKQAEKVLIAAGMSRTRRKNHKDQLAAQLILADYLAHHGR